MNSRSIESDKQQSLDQPGTVLHWYDFICPFCYIAQNRNAILTGIGLDVVELPFSAHPEIPPGGIAVGPRSGPMYAMLEREARSVGLPLRWPHRLPNSRKALAAAEWVRRNQLHAFPDLRRGLFEAHFVLGEDLEDPAVIDRHAASSKVGLAELHAALADERPDRAVTEAEAAGRRLGVTGTPSWLLGGRLIVGLRPAAEFIGLANDARSERL